MAHSCAECGKEYGAENSLRTHYKRNPDHKPEEWPACPQCGERFGKLGTHWQFSKECSHPKLTAHQREVLTGLLMGDGAVNRAGKAPLIECNMAAPAYLYYLDSVVFPVMGTGVKFQMDAAESAERNRANGANPDADAQNYSDLYVWRTRRSPELDGFGEWYATGRKVFPGDIDLTPTVLKHWYACDGSWNTGSYGNSIYLHMPNERANKEKIERYFREGPDVEIIGWYEHEYESGSVKCDAAFSSSDTDRLFNYMGKALPGFEYKWPSLYHF